MNWTKKKSNKMDSRRPPKTVKFSLMISVEEEEEK